MEENWRMKQITTSEIQNMISVCKHCLTVYMLGFFVLIIEGQYGEKIPIDIDVILKFNNFAFNAHNFVYCTT